MLVSLHLWLEKSSILALEWLEKNYCYLYKPWICFIFIDCEKAVTGIQSFVTMPSSTVDDVLHKKKPSLFSNDCYDFITERRLDPTARL